MALPSTPQPAAGSDPPSSHRSGSCSFGLYSLDLSTGELKRAHRPVHLAPQPTRVLMALIDRAGQVVTREELKESIWGDHTFVDFEQGLNYCIKQIRAALGDNAENPRFIETLPRRGYRLIAPVARPLRVATAPQPALAESPPVAVQPPTARRPVLFLTLSIVAALIVVAATGYLAWSSARPAVDPPPAKAMIAVLPFQNLSGDPDQVYFSDGFTEELIAQLGRIDPARLGVIARTSTLAFRDSTKSAAEIGSELGVHHLVEGTVRRSGDRVRINAQLIRVADQSHIWAQMYEGEVHDILALQHQVGNAIARQIVASLAPVNGVALRKVDPDVYDLYLRGRFSWNRRRLEETEKAAALFKEAARRDPTFAPAHAGLADSLMVASRPAALASAERALTLDDGLAEAHTAKAHALMHMLQWERAEGEFRRAIALDPSYVPARYFYGEFLIARSRQAEGVKEAREGLALDPLSAIATHQVGVALYFSRDYSGALPHFQKALEIDPEHYWSYGRIALVQERQQSYDAALVSFERVKQPLRAAYVYGMLGRTAEARRILSNALARPEPELQAYHLASGYVGIGEQEEALKWLSVALRRQDYDVVYLAVDPRLDPLRSRREFQQLLRDGGW